MLNKYTWPGISGFILEIWNVTDVLQNFLMNLDCKKWHHLLAYSEGTVVKFLCSLVEAEEILMIDSLHLLVFIWIQIKVNFIGNIKIKKSIESQQKYQYSYKDKGNFL